MLSFSAKSSRFFTSLTYFDNAIKRFASRCNYLTRRDILAYLAKVLLLSYFAVAVVGSQSMGASKFIFLGFKI